MIKEKHKNIIKKICEAKLRNGEKIQPKLFVAMLSVDEKYAVYEIMQYIKQDLRISIKDIWHGEASYIIELPR